MTSTNHRPNAFRGPIPSLSQTVRGVTEERLLLCTWSITLEGGDYAPPQRVAAESRHSRSLLCGRPRSATRARFGQEGVCHSCKRRPANLTRTLATGGRRGAHVGPLVGVTSPRPCTDLGRPAHSSRSPGCPRVPTQPSRLAAHDGRELTSTRHVSSDYRWQTARLDPGQTSTISRWTEYLGGTAGAHCKVGVVQSITLV